MVVLQQNHVKQTYTVIHASAESYSFLLQITQSRSGLACIQHMAAGIGNQALIAMCRGCNTGHTLHHVEHRTFYLQ